MDQGAPSQAQSGKPRGAVPHTWEPEMGEDPLNDGRVVDRGHALHPP